MTDATGSDPKGRNLVIQGILAQTSGAVDQEEPVEDVETEEPVEEPTPAAQEEEVMTLNVLGKEVQAPKSKVIDAGVRALQKESAADERLRLAAQKEQEIKNREDELARMEQDLLKRKTTVDTDEAGREFADSIFTDPEKVSSTITGITRKIAELDQKVAESDRKLQEDENTRKQVVFDHYLGKYADIAGDDDMHIAMNRRFQQIAAKRRPTVEDIDTIAAEVYQKFGRSTASPSDVKKNLSPPLRQASARVKPPDKPKQKSYAEILDEVRQGRSMK